MRWSQFSKSLKRSIACSLQFSAQLCKEEFQKPSPSDFKNICSLWRDLRGLLGMAVPGYMEGHRRQKQVARRAHPKVQHVPGSAAAWPAFMDTCGANATSCSDASSTGSQTWLVPSYCSTFYPLGLASVAGTLISRAPKSTSDVVHTTHD